MKPLAVFETIDREKRAQIVPLVPPVELAPASYADPEALAEYWRRGRVTPVPESRR